MFSKPLSHHIPAIFDPGRSKEEVQLEKQTLLSQRRAALLHELPRAGLDALLHSLPALRGTAATALKNHVLDGIPIAGVWQWALAKNRPEVLRAILLLVDDQQLKSELAASLTGSQLQQALATPTVLNPALRRVLKEYPYYPGKFTADSDGRTLKNLNCRARFPAIGNQSPKEIVCRHLATYFFEESAKNPAAKFDYQAFTNIGGIQSSVKPETQLRFNAIRRRATETHLIHSKEFGKFLASQFTEMEQCSKKIKVALLVSENHVMAFSLRIKQKDNTTMYGVRFYDPNRTNGHSRNSSSSIHSFSSLSVESYLDETRLRKHYFPSHDALCSIFIHDSKINEPNLNNVQEPRKFTSIRCDISEEMIYALFFHGFDESLRNLKPALQAMPLSQRLALLSTTEKSNKLSAFVFSCHQEFSNVVRAFGELLEVIPIEKRFAMLEASISNLPVLRAMITLKKIDVIPAFSAAIRLLPADRQSEFLESRYEGTTAMEAALWEGDAAVISRYCDLIMSVKKDNIDDAKLLLMAKNENGQPFLHSAVISGQQNAVESYAIAISHLDQSDRALMCSVSDSAGMSPLCRALERGNAAAILGFKALLEVIPAEDRVELLVTKDAWGVSGLRHALENGHTQAIEAYSALLETITPNERLMLYERNYEENRHTLNSPSGNRSAEAYVAYLLMMER